MSTDPEQNNIRIAMTQGYRVEKREHPHYPFRLIWNNGQGSCWWGTEGGAWSHGLPNYYKDISAALTLCEAVSDRFDVIIRKHNNHHWRVEFCEPSHEYSASHESLATAICDAFLALPAPQP